MVTHSTAQTSKAESFRRTTISLGRCGAIVLGRSIGKCCEIENESAYTYSAIS